jgi:hypothetical protein
MPLSPATPSLYPLEAIRPAIHSFWTTYAAAMEVTRPDAVERLVAFAGARLLQTVYESMVHVNTLTPQSVLQLQSSMSMLRDPHAAAVMLGIEAGVHV